MNRFLKWLALAMSLTFAACNRSPIVPPDNEDTGTEGGEVSYLSDNEGYDEAEPNARVAASVSGKVTFEYLNNETEIFRPSNYDVKLWRFDEDPIDPYLPTTKPTYIVHKTTARSYVRKTVKIGWYLAEFDGSGKVFVFHVTNGSDGLLIYNEHDWNSQFSGYFKNYGKIKVAWKVTPRQDANTVLQFTGTPSTTIWIYAEDGTTKYKGQFWFMPTGTYQLTYNISTARTVTVNVVSGKTYPYIKMIS